MKTQILQLEPHDDLNSTRDKIGWDQTGRILLVWPSRGRLLTRRLDLLLLQRHCRALGTQLALVTHDPDVRYHARSLKISVFKDAKQAQEARWKRPSAQQTARRRSETETRAFLLGFQPVDMTPNLRPSVRVGFFSLGLLAVISLAAALFPSAEIRLTTHTQSQEMTLTLVGKTSARQVNLTGLVPIRAMRVLVEGRDSLEPSGQALAPLTYAQGRVRFTNLTAQIITIPAGTIVSPLGGELHFATTDEAWLARGPGSALSVPVIAIEPGSQSNLPAESIQSIQGPLGPNLAVTNPTALTGGSELPSPAPTALDRSKLHDRLKSSLQASALAEIQTKLGVQDLLLSNPPTLVRTLEEVYKPAGEQPANKLELSLRLEFEAFFIAAKDLEFFAISILDANLPAGVQTIPGSLRLKILSSPVLDSQTEASLEMQAHRSIQADFPADQPAYLVAGLTPAQARQRLEQNLPVSELLEIA
ncbi:MAG TPA: baseplate J/gp47 family protein, partial [Anaerolineales bacterium]|nr:baseplate J/gp47 family protein [Anaerolineales bacterium]